MPEISNREHFINGEDYYILTRENAMDEIRTLEIPPREEFEKILQHKYTNKRGEIKCRK